MAEEQDDDDDVDDLVVTRTPQSPHMFRAEPVHELLFSTDDPELQKMCGHVQDRRVCMLVEADHAKWLNNSATQTVAATLETPASRPAPETPRPEPAASPVTREFILGHALQRIVEAVASYLGGDDGPAAAVVATAATEIAKEALDDAARLP